MATEIDHEFLNQLLKKAQTPSEYNLTPEELKPLASAFLLTRQDPSNIRPKAYVVLSAICQSTRSSQMKGDPEASTRLLVRIFAPVVVQLFGETDYTSLSTGAAFLAALFQVDSASAISIFTREGLIESVTDSVDLSPIRSLSLELAHLLDQACGHKPCRSLITPQIMRWLDFKSQQVEDTALQSAAALALIKLAKGASTDAPENGTPEVPPGKVDTLFEVMVNIIVSGEADYCLDAVEALAYLSTEPQWKERLVQNPAFLKQLFALFPTKNTTGKTALSFGIMTIICNLTSFRPRLNEEQQQMEKLKKMAKGGASQMNDVSAALDDDEHVKIRIRTLISAGVLAVFAAAASVSDGLGGIRQSVARSLLCIVEENDNRGKVLQAGGAKVLQTVIKQALPSQSSGAKVSMSSLAPPDLDGIQALAKLSITASPIQVFGPNIGAIYDVIRPLSFLLLHPSSTPLQKFEAVMALTNLASHSPDIASRIAKAEGVVDKVELLLLEDHTLIRRASVELLCNLIGGSDDVFERYSQESPNAASKLHILLALSDVEDLPTRLAASGALATLSSSPSVSKMLVDLQFEKHRFLPIMTQLLDPESLVDIEDAIMDTTPGLVHRAAVCICNLVGNTKDKSTKERLTKEARECGLLSALIRVAKGDGVAKEAPILNQAIQALKVLIG